MPSNSQTPASRSRIGWIAGLAAVPIVVLLAGVLYSIRTERAAAAELVRLTQYGGSADAWATKLFRSRTHTEGTAAWSEISMLANASSDMAYQLPILGTVEFPEDFDPTADWKEEPAVAAYLAEMQPLLELIQASKGVPKPVWQPIQFDGVQTLLPHLQNSRQIMRVLQLEALHAMHKRDPERVLAALESMHATAEVYDWNLFLVGEFVHLALRAMFETTIGDALQVDMWSPEQIATLDAYVAEPIGIAAGWARALDFEELFGAEWQAPGGLFPISAKDRLAMLQKYRQIGSLGKFPVGELSKAAAALDSELEPSSFLENQLLPAVRQGAAALDRTEYFRRLVRTAIAIKRYKLKNNAFPKQLEDLSDVGLTAQDWSIPTLGKFGYEVYDDQVVVFNYILAETQLVTENGVMNPTKIERLPGVQYFNVRVR